MKFDWVLARGDGCSTLPVVDIEWRAFDIRLFKPAIVVPPLTFVIQYASITESNSESPSLVSTNKRDLNIEELLKIVFTSFQKFIRFRFFHCHKTFQCSICSTFIWSH